MKNRINRRSHFNKKPVSDRKLLAAFGGNWFFHILCKEFLPVSHNKDKGNDQRQDITDIESCPLWEFRSLAGIGFSDKVFPSPSPFACTEEKIYQTSERQQVVGNNKVFQILNGASGAERRDIAQYIKAEDARHGEDDDQNSVDDHGLFTAPVSKVDGEADDILEYGDDG